MNSQSDEKVLAADNELRKITDEQRELISLLNELADTGMWWFSLDENGEFSSVLWDDGFRHLLGFENEQDFPNVFESWTNRLHPDDREIILERVRHAAASHEFYDVKYRLQKKTGEYDWFRARGKVGRFVDGKPTMLFGTIVNITMSERETSDTNNRLDILLGSVNGGLKICRDEEDWPYDYVSENVAALQGYSVDELLTVTDGSPVNNIYGPDRAAVVADCQKQLAATGTHSLIYRIKHKNGSFVWIHDFGRLVTMPDGRRLIYGLVQDITEQENTRMQLAAERAQYRAALTSHSVYSLYIDVDEGTVNSEIITSDGTPLLADLGLTPPVMYDTLTRRYVEKYNTRFINPQDKRCFSIAGLKEMYAEKSLYSTVSYYMPATDTHIEMLVLLAKDPVTEHIIFNGIAFDESAKIRRENEQRRLIEDALARAEHANRAKTTFLNNISHDIRTPMNAIIGFTALASAHIENREKVIDYLKKIQTSSNHLLSLINDVLDMSRIESGKVKIEEKEVSLPEVMHDLKNIVQADVRNKQLELYFDTVDITDEFVWCDRLRLSQILLNCISNAIKYTPAHGAIGIKVIQVPCNRPGYASYEFRIKDTGIGMSEDFLAHIFEPFSRESTSTVSGIQGTGLGMAITKNIVDIMGGTISATSVKDKGSEFIICLTLEISDEQAPRDYAIPALKSVNALVVDDNYDTCDSIVTMLKTIGLRPDWTMSGREAVIRTKHAVSHNDPYGVYIIDWLMPDMNGIEVVRRIRAEIGDDVPIIILTAYDWSEIEQEAKAAGVTCFCSKPIFMSELHNMLQQAVNGFADAKDRGEETPTISLDGMKILLVEDNELNREIAETILEEAGARVDSAEDGNIGVNMVKDAPAGTYDLILMDVQMPTMNGYEATRAIRALKDQDKANIKIIAMTANAFDEDKKNALAVGMNAHIPKPIDVDNLIQTIQAIAKA